MDIVERYLQATRFWLPLAQQQDIINELSDDIRCQLDARAAEAGRPLSEEEAAAVLKRWGSPLAVAQRYLPPRYLIGPMLFPIYLLVLKIYLYTWVGPWLAVWIGLVIFDPGYHVKHPGMQILGTLSSLWIVSVNLISMTTLGFALVERFGPASVLWKDWNPRKLPPARDLNRIPRSASAGELAGNFLFALWWVNVLHLPSLSPVEITPSPIWQACYWPILFLTLAISAVALANMIQPHWTRARAAVRLAIDSCGAVLAVVLLSAGQLVTLRVPDATAAQLSVGEKWIQASIQITLAAIAIHFVFRCIQNARRALGRMPFDNWALRALTGG